MLLFAISNCANTQDNDQVFEVVEEMPRFPGCEHLKDLEERRLCAQNKMLAFLYKELTIQPIKKNASICTTLVYRFIIEKDGSISNIEELKSCDDYHANVRTMLEQMPKWIPGKKDGQAVRVRFNLPIRPHFK